MYEGSIDVIDMGKTIANESIITHFDSLLKNCDVDCPNGIFLLTRENLDFVSKKDLIYQ